MGERFRAQRRCFSHLSRQLLKHRSPTPTRRADDFVIRGFAPDILIRRNGGEYGNASLSGEGMGFTRAIILVDDHAGHADIAAELAEILHRGTHIIRDIKRLQVIGPDNDHLLAHIARDRQAEATADHIAQEVEQHVVEIPLMEAKLFQQLKAMDNTTPTATTAHFRAAQFHGENAIALEADIADGNSLTGGFLLR